MSFGGAVSSMITSLRNNEKLRSKRKHFDKNAVGSYSEKAKPEYDLPEATPRVLRSIKTKMQEDQRKTFIKRAYFLAALILLFTLLLVYLG